MAASSFSAAESLRRDRILPGKLYFDVPPSKVLVIYSSSYDIAFLGIEKMVPTFLGSKGCHQIMGSTMLNYYFDWYPLQHRIFLELMLIMKVPQVALLSNDLVQNRVLYPYRKQVRGSILAAKIAIERGWAINVGGGFHHCSAEKGGGFCVYAIFHYAFSLILSMINHLIDLFGFICLDFQLFCLNICQVMNNMNHKLSPSWSWIIHNNLRLGNSEAKRYIDLKVELVSGTKTKEYLDKLDEALEVARNDFDPELVVYNAGTDVLGDPLGRLKVCPDGVSVN
ncbi:unnamed protein product [Musa acuminata subsp. malaccensis]|uniref:(wild Malaysian banana) hypothetical protein n=1 Tax=Musa acuminata subsp. malaccensis TaxID=214687 RepID=A0A804JTS1_MUSAM|nr:unnamed protein product [Musa acuminata subsp. malaccensis]